MQFRTVIPPYKELNIHHQDMVMLFGSCFTENIGQRLIDHKFTISCNPLGILFNPISIQQTILRIAENREVKQSELLEQNGVWNSYDFHSQFAQLSSEDYLKNINEHLLKAHQFLIQCDTIFITLGTAWIFEEKESLKVVANCHKMPANLFIRRRISVDECTNALINIIQQLNLINPSMHIIFTVSPIRHWKDGAHGNQLSKSTLLLAIDNICNNYSNCCYFPSYEILMDDLRDYRYYADDLLHPNTQAQEYIWNYFGECFFDEKTILLNQQIEQIEQAVHHRPFNPLSNSHLQFKQQTIQKIEALERQYSFLHFDEEKKLLRE